MNIEYKQYFPSLPALIDYVETLQGESLQWVEDNGPLFSGQFEMIECYILCIQNFL